MRQTMDYCVSIIREVRNDDLISMCVVSRMVRLVIFMVENEVIRRGKHIVVLYDGWGLIGSIFLGLLFRARK